MQASTIMEFLEYFENKLPPEKAFMLFYTTTNKVIQYRNSPD